MLSNPTNNLHNRQRQHRRQQSTPHAFEPVKVESLPNIQRHGSHRRGMSLDQRRRQTPPQEINVSITNTGYQTTPQHILRETQQQRLARPGRQSTRYDNDENFLNSPLVTPQRQSFDAGCGNASGNQYTNRGHQAHYSYSGPINTIIDVNLNNFTEDNDFNLFPSDGSFTPTAYMDFSANFDGSQCSSSGNHSRRTSTGRRISTGIVDRVAQFENMALQSPQLQRPVTPPNQNVANYFPPTPVDTPQDRMVKHEPMNQRFLDTYDTSMEETIKPRSNQRARGIFDDMRKESEKILTPSSSTTSLSTQDAFDSAPMPTANFMNMSNINMEFMKNEAQYDLQYSPTSSNISAHNSSPESSQSAVFADSFTNKLNMEASMSYPDPADHSQPIPSSPDQDSQYRRSESISSVNLDESITETGITIDDIASFIQGPDPVDGKWLCLYPECKKRFGRKENIKSHVQTHLGDRQFQCPHCRKCFVRQHDLKRHAKIHSGVKPYPCQCGNSFARHDALTRHRQRGMCIGAFEGVVKKTVKRGRPRKPRPDNEERLKKSSRTRSKNKSTSSASSTTGCSESNASNSPRSDFDLLDEKPFEDYNYSQASSVVDNQSFEYPSQPYSQESNDYVSPQETQTAHSPSAFSTYSQSSNGSCSESTHLPQHPSSPAKSALGYHSPPGLCESSSSPAPSNNYYDLENSSQNGDALNMNLSGLANISEHDDEMFLQAFAAASNGEMTQLERDPDLLMGKFEDAFNPSGGSDLFKNEEDVFFGSP